MSTLDRDCPSLTFWAPHSVFEFDTHDPNQRRPSLGSNTPPTVSERLRRARSKKIETISSKAVYGALMGGGGVGGGKGPPLSYTTPRRSECRETKRRSNDIYSEHPRALFLFSFFPSSSFFLQPAAYRGCSHFLAAVERAHKGNICPRRRGLPGPKWGDVGVFSAGPGAELRLKGTLMGNERLSKGSIMMAWGGWGGGGGL